MSAPSLGGHARGQGAVDGHPIAMALFLFMVFVLLQWMTQSGGPLVGCSTCQANVATFFSPNNRSTSWMLYLVVPITMAMMVTWLTDKIAEQDEGSVGDLARQLQRLAPQAGLREVSSAVRFRGTRAEAARLSAQEVERSARRVELARQRAVLGTERVKVLNLINNPLITPAEQLRLRSQLADLDSQLDRVSVLTGKVGVSKFRPVRVQPGFEGAVAAREESLFKRTVIGGPGASRIAREQAYLRAEIRRLQGGGPLVQPQAVPIPKGTVLPSIAQRRASIDFEGVSRFVRGQERRGGKRDFDEIDQAYGYPVGSGRSEAIYLAGIKRRQSRRKVSP